MTALAGLDARLRLARLYLCTDARERQGDLSAFLAEVLAGGVDIVRVWQPGLDPEVELAALQVARRAAARHQAIVAVSGSAAVARRFGADMLHLAPDDRSAAAARAVLQPAALVGRAALDEHQVLAAVGDGDLDYFSLGPVFRSPSSPGAKPAGLELVRYAALAAPVFSLQSKPWFAVGGITVDTLGPVLQAGARRICVASALTRAPDPRGAAAELSAALRDAWRSDPAAERYTFAAAASTGRH